MAEPGLASHPYRAPMPARCVPRARLVSPGVADALGAAGEPVLGSVRYGDAAAVGEDGAPRVEIPLPHLDEPLVEVWLGEDRPTVERRGRWTLASAGGVLFGAAMARERAGEELERAAAGLYDELLGLCDELDHPFLWRIWNSLPGINAPGVDGLERYKRFCRARADAFASAYGRGFERRLCSSTAVGSPAGDAVVVHFIAGRWPGVHHENPRQVSAYHYPDCYGPRSPSFARATAVHWGGRSELYVAGTASIVGHETCHHGDVAAQLAETICNLRVLLESDWGGPARPVALKTYLRHPEHVAFVKEGLAKRFPGVPGIVVHADICRRDLLLEIELVAGG